MNAMKFVSKKSFRSICVSASVLAACVTQSVWAAETVQQLPAPPGHTIWRITEPNVKKARTDYPQIVFSAGHTVTVNASGCVQTGGVGHTWKRYVDPAGPNSDRMYFGELLIPGAMTNLQRFDMRQPTVYTIAANAVIAAGQNHLVLGYTDDDFGDNGYYSRNSDDGNLSQCWGLGNAAVTFDIGPLPAPAQPPAKARYTFTIKNVEIRSLRSPHSDTDVIAANVVIDGTPSAVAKESVGNWGRGSHNTAVPIIVDEVAPGDRVAVNYSIVNAGHNSTGNSVDDALVSIIGKLGSAIPGAGSLVSAAAEAWGAFFNLVDADCDGPVVADSVTASGADLSLWTQAGPVTRTISFIGTDSARGCGSNSFYEVTYEIARANDLQTLPYSLDVNLRSRQAKVSQSAVLLKVPVH